jgi:hypothetical protein
MLLSVKYIQTFFRVFIFFIKVGQLHVPGEIVVQCQSEDDANKLHQKVKVARNIIIGFRKLQYVRILRGLENFTLKRIREATPDEYKIHRPNEDYVKEIKKIMGKDGAEAGGSSEAKAEVAGPKVDAEPAGSKKRRL